MLAGFTRAVAPTKIEPSGAQFTDHHQGANVSDASHFTKLVPGFEFLQDLVKGAGAALPNMGQWVAPTLNPEELEKRISELRTVQFWLEQNTRMLGATIQALEVQRMTLSTLKTMNVQMEDLRESLKVKSPQPTASAGGAPAAAPLFDSAQHTTNSSPAVDPMQWWSALTKQFTELASAAVKDSAAGAAKSVEGLAKATQKAANSPAPEGHGAAVAAGGVKRAVTTKTAASKTRGARLGSKR